MLRRGTQLAAAVAAVLAIGAPAASAVAPDPNPWRGFGFLNMAHQGGEDEAPSNTLFAFKSAINTRGADTLELDVNRTSDGRLVVIHDHNVNRTTEGTGRTIDLTLAQIQALDGSYAFRPPGIYDETQPDSAYPYRGMATGAVAPPAGYTADDFRISTIEEVLDAFPSTPINIEIKIPKNNSNVDDPALGVATAQALANVLNQPQYADRTDLLVVSFSDLLLNEFHSLAPDVALAPSAPGVLIAIGGGTPNPDVAAFQVPPYQGDLGVPETLLAPPPGADAHGRGYAVHVWTNGAADETDASYKRLTDLGVEGIMTSQPSQLHRFLCAAEIPRPNGTDRCPNPPVSKKKKKKCKKGFKLKKIKKKGKKKGKKPKKKCVKVKKKKKKKKKRSAASRRFQRRPRRRLASHLTLI